MKINDLSFYDKPYEKLENYGEKALTDKELLAILIRNGTKNCSALEIAENLLNIGEDKYSLSNLHRKSINDLVKINGIGKIKAIQIKALLELSIRISKENYPQRPLLNTPEAISSYYMERLRHLSTEVLWVICLDVKGRLICDQELFKGSVKRCVLSPREVFIMALENKAVNIILLHNHPSGSSTPSEEDIIITKKIEEIGKELDINLWDHVIFGDKEYCSLREKGFI